MDKVEGWAMMKVIFLGTNGWYDSGTGNTISVLLRTADYDIIFDAGYGLAKMDQYRQIHDMRPAYLFLSHFHLDHVVGLHTLAKMNFNGGLTICGPAGSQEVLNTLVNQPFTLPLTELPYPARVLELPESLSLLPFKAEAEPLRHASLTMGYRIEIEGRTVTYCADTGYCENAVHISRNADLAITECAFASGRADEAWPHLNPETAARIAIEAQARRLALVHFDALQYPELSDRSQAAAAARAIFPDTVAATDGLEIDII
jgi:ribonuclease BN (tRNA processing enzyme)